MVERVAETGFTRNELETNAIFANTWQWEHFLKYGVDLFFICRYSDLTLTEHNTKPSTFWKQTGYTENGLQTDFEGEFKLPKDKSRVALYSKYAYKNPHMMLYGRLPSLNFVGNETALTYYFGLENGALYFNGIHTFYLETTSSYTNRLYVFSGELSTAQAANIDIKKPVDFNTANHTYQIIVSQNIVLYLIDGNIVCMSLPCGYSLKYVENVNPYSIILNNHTPRTLNILHELWSNRTSTATTDVISPIGPYKFRVTEGYDRLQLNLDLYDENSSTKWNNKSVTSGAIYKSHPFPINGFNGNIYFKSSAGTSTNNLKLEVFIRGSWVVAKEYTYAANTTQIIPINGEGIMGRLSYTPNASGTISLAVVTLN